MTKRSSEFEFEFIKKILLAKGWDVACIVLSAALVVLVDYLRPNFFNHPNLEWSVSWDNIFRFYPLFLYGALISILFAFLFGIQSDDYDESVWALNFITSGAAGLLEEIGFRWLYVCLAMISISMFNLLLGTVAGTVLGIVLVILGLALIFSEGSLGLKTIGISFLLFGLISFWAIWYRGYDDPVYWFYSIILIPFINWTSLGLVEPVFHYPGVTPLFIYGIILANLWFRNTHAYQGLIGIINSWYFGLVMIYTVFFYGIGTAITVHALYNLSIHTTRYLLRKLVSLHY